MFITYILHTRYHNAHAMSLMEKLSAGYAQQLNILLVNKQQYINRIWLQLFNLLFITLEKDNLANGQEI